MSYRAETLDVRPLSGLMKALADDTRLRMVALLTHGELCVCHLAAALALGQPNTSQHLAVLRNAGVVDSRRCGSWVYYRLTAQAEPTRAAELAALPADYAEQAGLADDVARLRAAQGAEGCG